MSPRSSQSAAVAAIQAAVEDTKIEIQIGWTRVRTMHQRFNCDFEPSAEGLAHYIRWVHATTVAKRLTGSQKIGGRGPTTDAAAP